MARTRLALSSTLALLCRNDKATQQAKEALKSAEEAGSLSLTRLCRANVAQLQFRPGSIAQRATERQELLSAAWAVYRLSSRGPETFVATLLESGQCLRGRPEVEEFLDAMREHQEPSWVAVEAVPTQARVLHHFGDTAEAFAALPVGRSRSALRGHRDNVVRLSLIEAEFSALRAATRTAPRTACRGADRRRNPSIEIVGLSETSEGTDRRHSGAQACRTDAFRALRATADGQRLEDRGSPNATPAHPSQQR